MRYCFFLLIYTVKKAQNNKVYNSLIMLVLEWNSTAYIIRLGLYYNKLIEYI